MAEHTPASDPTAPAGDPPAAAAAAAPGAAPAARARAPVVLCILDGWGWRTVPDHNAVALADTPVFDRLWAECPHGLLSASGEAVGLPAGQIGNSEVGHMTIGAGRVLWQDLPRISRALAAGALERSAVWQDLIARLKASGGVAHVMGLVSDGGVHSHQDHMAALARDLSAHGIPVALHIITDGRDVAPRSAPGHVARLLEAVAPPAAPSSDGAGAAPVTVATLSGRYFPMDRDHRWERVQAFTRAVLHADGADGGRDPLALIAAQYAREVTDEFIPPHVMAGYRGVAAGDGLVAVNFRSDRMRQVLAALLDPGFSAFDRGPVPAFAAVAGMVQYAEALAPLMPALFLPETVEQTLGEVVAAAGLSQLRLAETEKYAHVTFFMNGGRDAPHPGEERLLIPSPRIATYDLQPEMSAPEVGERLAQAIAARSHDLIVVNFANPDMVGHTGILEAAMAAVAAVDRALGQAVAALEGTGGTMIVTADHGNAEEMWDPETGGPHTAHTLNPVPVLVTGPGAAGLSILGEGGGLADLAPTVLTLLGVAVPALMTGRSLVDHDRGVLPEAGRGAGS